MIYQKVYPTKNLRSYVNHFGLLKNDDSCNQATTFKIIADGCPGLIFQENPDCFLDKNKNKLPQLFLHGIATSHSQKTTRGQYQNISVYFRPHALKTIFGIDASELTNQHVELESIVKNNLADQLLHERKTERRIKILSDFLNQKVIEHWSREYSKVNSAVEKIKSNVEIKLSHIQSELNLSERSLERIFRTHIGISPKLFSRIARFQSALTYIRQQNFRSLTAVAYLNSYADQSHFNRECREFAGATPKQFLLSANEQIENFPEWKS